jgi:hypothetical protein
LSNAIHAATGWDDTCEEAASRLAALLAGCGVRGGGIRRRLCRLGVSRNGSAELASQAIDAADDHVEIRADALFMGYTVALWKMTARYIRFHRKPTE